MHDEGAFYHKLAHRHLYVVDTGILDILVKWVSSWGPVYDAKLVRAKRRLGAAASAAPRHAMAVVRTKDMGMPGRTEFWCMPFVL